MPQQAAKLSYECVEHLHTWIRANCPCALENEEFMTGLFVIVEMEVETALRKQHGEIFQHLGAPSLQ